MEESAPNHHKGHLGSLLIRAGWRPETLARRVNAALSEQGSSRRVHEKTPYKWIKNGETPHGEVPDLVVQLLSTALDSALSFEEVWGVRARRPETTLRVDDSMDVPWDSSGLLSLLGGPVPTRRTILALSGVALTGHAWRALQYPAPTLTAVAAEQGRVTPPLLAMVESVVTHAQQLDTQHGGAARAFVADQFAAVARLLRHASYPAATGSRLAAALAQLAQTSGFMAFDAHHDGEAQRWYLLALRAAHAAQDPALSASILALMSNQAADRGFGLDALQLASAAQEAAATAGPAVRALVTARSGLAHAAAGDLTGFHRMRDATLELGDSNADSPLPRWASYMDPVELDAITGRGLVMLAERLPVRRKQLLGQATLLLHARAHTPGTAPPQRSALRHGAWLSLAHLRNGDTDIAVDTAHRALDRLPHVASVRSVALLHRLQEELTATGPRHPAPVRQLIAELGRLPRRHDGGVM